MRNEMEKDTMMKNDVGGGVTKVQKNAHEFFELIEPIGIDEMFTNQYYQGKVGNISYSAEYSEQEERNFIRNAKKKELILQNFLLEDGNKNLLDVGCGEGYVLKYFHQKGWDVTGIDLSEYGMLAHNPDMRKHLRQGNCDEILGRMIEQGLKFDVVNSDLFIECCSNPVKALQDMKSVVKPDSGIVFIRVANCLSPLHKEFMKRGILREDIWFDRVGNYSYFGKESLEKLLIEIGFDCIEWYGDTFVDFNLMNPLTDYYRIDGAGKVCYKAMLDIEDVIADESLEKMVELEKIMGDLGLGRHITCICKYVKG